MVIPLQQDQILCCSKCEWRNNSIRRAGASCTEHPNYSSHCPLCGAETEYRSANLLEKLRYKSLFDLFR